MTWRRIVAIAVLSSIGGPIVLCALGGLVGSFLDGHVALEADEIVPVPPDALFDLLDDRAGLDRWWTQAMADAGTPGSLEIRAQPGPDAGVGAKIDFLAGGTATETWTILELDPPVRARYDVDFKLLHVDRTITLAPVEGGTRVHWSETAEIENPWMKLMNVGGHQDILDNFHKAIRALGKAAQPPK